MVEKFYRELIAKMRTTHQQVQVIIKKNKEKDRKDIFNEKALFLTCKFTNLCIQALNLLGVEGLVDPEDEQTIQLVSSLFFFLEEMFELYQILQKNVKSFAFRSQSSGNYSKLAENYYKLLCTLFWWVANCNSSSCSLILGSSIFNLFISKFESLRIKSRAVFPVYCIFAVSAKLMGRLDKIEAKCKNTSGFVISQFIDMKVKFKLNLEN